MPFHAVVVVGAFSRDVGYDISGHAQDSGAIVEARW